MVQEGFEIDHFFLVYLELACLKVVLHRRVDRSVATKVTDLVAV